MVVLLKFRFGEISLIPKGYGFFFYLRKCTFFAIDPGKREGAMIWTVFFFHRVEKNTVPKPKILLTPQKSQMEAIFVKNQNWNSFQVFERFFFFNPSKKNAVKSDSWREGGEFICTPGKWNLYPFFHTSWKSGIFHGTLYCMSFS